MEIDLIYQSHHENLEDFNNKIIKTKWNTLLFVSDGEYSITLEGESKPLVLRKNEIAFVPADIEFNRSVLSPVTYHYFLFSVRSHGQFFSLLPTGKLKLPQNHAEAILESVRYAGLFPENRELVAHIIEHVLVENYLFYSRDNGGSKPFSKEIEEAARYMSENLEKKIDMDELAERVFLSHSGLIWKFKKELNTTPSNYLYLLRMRNAKRLLIGYSYSVAEISERCGYQNPYYFTNAFHKYFGMSPTEFRKYYLNGKE